MSHQDSASTRAAQDAVKLKRLYRAVAADNAMLAAHAEWLQQVVTVLHGKRQWWWWFIPAWLFRSILLARLKRRNLFDDKAYARMNPDVAKARLDPLRHYALNGFREGRPTGLAEPTTFGASDLSARNAQSSVDDALRRRVMDSGMFDPDWYRAQYGGLIDDEVDPLSDYFAASDEDVLRDPGPLFSTAFYLESNRDARGTHPLRHFVERGMAEGCRAFPPDKVNAFLLDAPLQGLCPLTSFLNPDLPTIVLHWEEGNFFFTDIADYVTGFLMEKGFATKSLVSDAGIAPGSANVVVVAPHEYCVHGPGRSWSSGQFADAVYINTEQWHTRWFILAYQVFRRSGKVLDINPASAAGLARLGMRAGFVPLLPLPASPFAFDRVAIAETTFRLKAIKPLSYPDAFADRPYDVAFLGVLNDRRAQALAALAPTLAAYECFLHAPRFDGPLRSSDPDMISSRDFGQIARHSRILLNVHQGETNYFEWHRLFLSGIAQGCVVVTEPCTPLGVLTQDEHYLTATLGEMPGLIEALLGTHQGRSRLQAIHENCRKLMREIDAGEGLAATW